MDWIRPIAFSVLCLLGSSNACAQYTFTTTPSPPIAGQPFQVSMRGSFPGSSFSISPVITVIGSVITVDLHGSCGIPCAASSTFTKIFTMPALPYGSYTATVNLDTCCRPEFGQFAFGTAGPAVPSLSTSAMALPLAGLMLAGWLRLPRH